MADVRVELTRCGVSDVEDGQRAETNAAGLSGLFGGNSGCDFDNFSVAGKVAGPANLILNGSFESWVKNGTSQLYETMLPGSNTLPHWRVTDNGVDVVYSPAPGYSNLWQASDGTFSLDLNAEKWGGVEQDFEVLAGHNYEVAFDLAGNWMGYPSEWVHTMTVTMGELTPIAYGFDSTGRTAGDPGWVRRSFTFTATQDGMTTLRFQGDPTHIAAGPALDNVRVIDIGPSR
jgi:choice-of-anchor C domain-containing protein